MQARLVSRSDGSLYEIELLSKDVRDLENGGVHPWTAEDDAESHLILYNHSASRKKFDVAVWNGTMLWDKTYYVDASETLEISFNQLMRDKVKDDRKQILDPALNHGVVNWSTPNGGDATGRLMVTSRNAVMARNYSCGNFTIPCTGYLNQWTDYLGFGQAEAIYGLVVGYCNSYAPGPCYGSSQGGGSANFTNTMAKPNIIALNNASQQASQSPVLKGVAAGSASFSESAEGNGCTEGGSGGATVQVPTAVPVIKTLSNGPSTCPAGQAGWRRYVDRQVVDQNGTAIQIGGKTINEVVTQGPGPNGLNFTPVLSPGVTDDNGQIQDNFIVCSKFCPSSSNTSTFTQVASEFDSGQTFPLGTYTLTYSCSNVKVNGLLTP